MHHYFVHYVYTRPDSKRYGFGNQEMAIDHVISFIEDVRALESQIALSHPAGTYVAIQNYVHLRETS